MKAAHPKIYTLVCKSLYDNNQSGPQDPKPVVDFIVAKTQ
jgi:hypothetical protein